MAKETPMAYDFDLSALIAPNGYAVHCETREQAEAFHAYLRENYPEKLEYWPDGETNWGIYREETAYALCYLDDEDDDDRPIFDKCGLTYGTPKSYEEDRFQILKFEDILASSGMDEADQTIDELLGLYGVPA